jgi:hypothetical protein
LAIDHGILAGLGCVAGDDESTDCYVHPTDAPGSALAKLVVVGGGGLRLRTG